MQCPKCATVYDDSFKFCPNCTCPNPLLQSGQSSSQPTVPNISQQSTQQPYVVQPPASPQYPQAFQQPGYIPDPTQASVKVDHQSFLSRQWERLESIGWKKLAIAGAIIVVVTVGIAVGLTVWLSGGNETATTGDTESVAIDSSNMTFTNENWNQVCSNAAGYKGAKVDGLIGKIFVAPEVNGSSIAVQMYADPSNSDQATIVYYSGNDASQFANGDIVKVSGIVGDEFSGTNAMGGTIVDPTIDASSMVKTDVSALIQGGKEVVVAQQQNQNGVVVIVDKMLLRNNETDVFIRVSNQSGRKANFYAFNSKLQVGNQQLEQDSTKGYQYGEIPSDILPGIEVKGVLAFPALGTAVPQNGAVALHLEAQSDDYMVDFNPYVFNITW